jgi:DNA polymerase-3 subunit gamma/tau
MDEPPPWGVSEEAPAKAVEAAPPPQIQESKTSDINDSNQPTEWHEITPLLTLSGRAAEVVKHCVLDSVENNQVKLSLDKYGEDLLAKTTASEIESALSEYYKKPINLLINTQHLSDETPAERTNRKKQERQQIAENLINNDPFVKDLQNRFKAQVVPNSIKPK